MTRMPLTARLLAVGALTTAVALTPQLTGSSLLRGGSGGGSGAVAPVSESWVNTWVSMPQLTETSNLPPAPFTTDTGVFTDSTVRTTIRTTVAGHRMRLRFSNAFGGAALPITKVSVARPAGGAAGVSAIEPGSSRAVTFAGKPSESIPVGAQYASDPLNVDVPALTNLTVTIYLATGQQSLNVTSHPGSRTTSYMLAGDHVGDADLPGAASVAHWYFLSGVETVARATASVMLGDSITDGRGSTTNFNDRWPDQLVDRLQKSPATRSVAILNQAAGGNRVLNDGLGPNALARLDRDVLTPSGVRSVIVFEGVNDIGTAAATEADQKQVTSDLIAAFDQIIVRSHAQGLKVYGATITPFGGNEGYDDATGFREASRQAVNRWIRTSHHFDAVIDFDAVTRDPAAPRQLQTALDTGDHLHLTPTGYGVMAGAVPARLFR